MTRLRKDTVHCWKKGKGKGSYQPMYLEIHELWRNGRE